MLTDALFEQEIKIMIKMTNNGKRKVFIYMFKYMQNSIRIWDDKTMSVDHKKLAKTKPLNVHSVRFQQK